MQSILKKCTIPVLLISCIFTAGAQALPHQDALAAYDSSPNASDRYRSNPQQ